MIHASMSRIESKVCMMYVENSEKLNLWNIVKIYLRCLIYPRVIERYDSLIII